MNTQKLKELARRATGGTWNAFINEKTNTFSIHTPDDARCGNIVDWMGFDGVDCSKKQKAHNARFIAASNPAAVIELIERLEAAERERDELREWLKCVEAERDKAISWHSSLLKKFDNLQAEIARQDASAGEASDRVVDDGDGQQIGGVGVSDRLNCLWPIGTKFYTAAPPAALPPPMTYANALKVSDWKNDQASIWTEGANWMRQQCLEMGAQPQKVVELHKRKSTEVISGQRYSYVLLEDLLPELDAAGVKWEVKK